MSSGPRPHTSWFGDEPPRPSASSGLRTSEGGDSSDPGDANSFFLEALQQAESTQDYVRLYRAFLLARVALGVVLVGVQWVGMALGSPQPTWLLVVCAGYTLLTLLMWALPRGYRLYTTTRLATWFSLRWWASVGLDLVVFGLMQAFGSDNASGMAYAALFVLPVLMAGVLTPRRLALATAALAAILILSAAAWHTLQETEMALRLTQAALMASGMLLLGLLSSELAQRLDREQRAARGHFLQAQQQAALNQLVMDEMSEGVLVVDRQGGVRAANPASRQLLGHTQSAPYALRGVPAWAALVDAVELAFSSGTWPTGGRDIVVPASDGVRKQRVLRLRLRFTRRRSAAKDAAAEDICLIFLEDMRDVLARTRQEKLAAMGRVTAGVAHEIRNPLAAIDQANALLAEDLSDPRAQQLTRMVASNVQRLKRIVEDVLEVAPSKPPEATALEACALVSEIVRDWAQTNGLADGPQSVLHVLMPPPPVMVRFEPDHLRRVLINLLDNGLRHSPLTPGALMVRLTVKSEQWVRLTVFSEGEPIPPEVEQHLFEPFFSTRSRGSGLGLFICRELCERYGARMDHRTATEGTRQGNAFRILLRRSNSHAPMDLFDTAT